jgi:hypothetical protein
MQLICRIRKAENFRPATKEAIARQGKSVATVLGALEKPPPVPSARAPIAVFAREY